MLSWPRPDIPALLTGESAQPGAQHSTASAPVLRLYDTADDRIKPVALPTAAPGAGEDAAPVGMYVCGITPYDSTHLGHAATYLAFDLIHRYLLSAGYDVHFVENITDVDDPLFERAARDGVDWRELGTSQIDLFRSDMEDLEVIPPQDYIGAIESIDEVIEMVTTLLDKGAAYQLTDDEYPDIYVDHTFTPQFGYESRYNAAEMATYFAERGGDPDRPGKRHPLDALVWCAQRPDEPSWDAPFGAGRPGWHVECSAIATNRLGAQFAIQGGGRDLRFPHHEFSAAHAEAAHGVRRMAEHYVHTGMISLDGTKMSKSLGNLVFVHKLTAAGHEPGAIRLGVYAGHYRSDRDWSDDVLAAAEHRLAEWRNALLALHAADTTGETGTAELAIASTTVANIRARLSDDLDTPGALASLDQWADGVLSRHGHLLAAAADDSGDLHQHTPDRDDNDAGRVIVTAVRALFGVAL